MCFLVASQRRTTDIRDIAGISAIVANWAPNSRSMYRYLKELFRSSIICNRLTDLSMLLLSILDHVNTDSIIVESPELIPEELLQPKAFHRLENELESRWNEHSVNQNFVVCTIAKALKHLEPKELPEQVVCNYHYVLQTFAKVILGLSYQVSTASLQSCSLLST